MPRHVGHITGWLWLEGTSSSPSPLLKQGWLPRSMSRLQSQTLEVAGFSGGRREDFSEDAPTGWQKMPFCIMKRRAGGGPGLEWKWVLATRKYMGPTEVGAAPRKTKNSPKSHQCSFIRAHGAELGAVL